MISNSRRVDVPPPRTRGRQLPIGAELQPGGTHFRVWAPIRDRVEVVLEDGPDPRAYPLGREDGGYFSGFVSGAGAGDRYRFRLDSGGTLYPDPASRFQPEGPHGPSQLVDPNAFRWTDVNWKGVDLPGQVIYELHVGTFSPEGTWDAAAKQIGELANLGVTVIEVMPVADFVGRFGWGYDGVDLFAPTRLYGEPDAFRGFVNRAHAAGLGVILDVVYNHFGPEGCYWREFSPDYFSTANRCEWGEAINFDGPGSGPIRAFYRTNAAYWIDEFHLDGLRLDATQAIFDSSTPHILEEIGRAVRGAAAERKTIIVAENETQNTRLVKPADGGGYGLNAVWNDDYHHSAMVALTGQREAYYADYRGTPDELVAAVKYGFLYQGQYSNRQQQPRGTPTFGVRSNAFVDFLQNHDQIANSARGWRIHALTSPGRFRALTTLTLLGPATPMLFMGEEFAASSPFLYFADHEPELARLVRDGRVEFLAQFPSLTTPEARGQLADPGAPSTFDRCKLDVAEREAHAPVYRLHRDLLQLRRTDEVLRRQGQGGFDGAVLGSNAFLLRFFGDDGDDRLLVVNLGVEQYLTEPSQPLLAPPLGRGWELLWSSQDFRYGGNGTPANLVDAGWTIPGESALLWRPVPGSAG